MRPHTHTHALRIHSLRSVPDSEQVKQVKSPREPQKKKAIGTEADVPCVRMTSGTSCISASTIMTDKTKTGLQHNF
jgi:hypothetical protein